VQSLRNYRLLCPNAQFLRDGKVCEDCLGKRIPLPAVWHSCYRGNRAGTAVVASMLSLHRLLRTWTRAVDVYYALTEFSRQKFVQGGLPADRIAIKPNFLHPDPGPGTGRGGYAVFVGRLSPEKGIDTLLAAWTKTAEPLGLKIIGNGPLADRVRAVAASDSRITWLGRCEPADVMRIVGDAVCLVLPSIWYEGFPRTILEAFAKGTPVIASRLGSMAELIEHGQTGLHFEPASASDLVAKLLALRGDRAATARMRQGARRQYELKYTAEPNDHMLMQIYQRALRGQRRLADDSNISATPLAPHLAEAGVLSNGSVEG
jgi:glycosyltransferase involved in cell wall biosynthesis